jgi:PAS domain S-box-containing protein
MPGGNVKREGCFVGGEAARRAITVIAVLFILSSIATSTVLALRQAKEQNAAMRTLEASGRLKHDLDEVQQMMLDEHGELYTLIGTRPFYKRAAYIFPLPALLALTGDARGGCRQNAICLSRLADLDDMIQKLARRSNTLAIRASLHPASIGVSDPALGEIDAYFYSVLERVVDVRMGADATIGSSVSKSSSDAKWFSNALMGCALTAAVLLLALILWNGRIAQKLRAALRLAETAREKYQRFFDKHPLPIWIFDNSSLDILAVNGAAQRTYGYSEGEFLGMSLLDVRPPDELGRLYEAVDTGRKTSPSDTQSVGTWVHQTKSGERRSMDIHHLKVEFDGRPATMSVMVDVTVEVVAQAELFKSKQTLEYILDHIPQGIAWKDAQHRYVGGNEIYARDAGLPSRFDLIGKTDRELRWGDDPQAVQEEDIRVMAGDLTKRHFERRAVAVDRSEVWISETKLPLEDQNRAVIGVLTAYENITARRNAELALRLQSRAIDASINGLVIAEVEHDRYVIMFANAAFERITGYSPGDVVGVDCEVLFAIAGEAQKW